MARRLSLAFALGALALPLLPVWGKDVASSCPRARLQNSWCATRGVGYLAGLPMRSRRFFEMLDAHGHDLDLAALDCRSCRQAMREDGFCSRCRRGFVARRAYLSRLAHVVARGKVEDLGKLACARCRRNALGHGWCEACGVGRVGALRVGTRKDLEQARSEVERLRRALRLLARCEDCAMASYSGGWCRHCKRSFDPIEPSGTDADADT